MTLRVLGVNHKTAPIEVRERIAISRDALGEATATLAALEGVAECMIVSTCNRVEIVAAVDEKAPSENPAFDFMVQRFGISEQELKPHIYEHSDREAVRHLFRVAASLDSMVVGESQILGQVKEAFTVARTQGTIGGQLEHLLQSVFSAAKKVRTDTEIGSNSVSIASVAVELARKIFGTLTGKTVLIVGAGKMSELSARHLVQQGADKILVTNRTRERAERMAERFNGKVIEFSELYNVAAQADIIITSTGAPHHVFTRKHAQDFMKQRRNKPMFFIDIAVPRDVEPEMNKIEGVFVYDIDDLQAVAAAHLAERRQHTEQAEAMIAREVARFHERQRAVNVSPAIVALQKRAEELRQTELKRVHAKLGTLTPEQAAVVEVLTRGLVNKFLHPPMQALKQAARENDAVRLEAVLMEWNLELDSNNVLDNKQEGKDGGQE